MVEMFIPYSDCYEGPNGTYFCFLVLVVLSNTNLKVHLKINVLVGAQ